MTNGALATAVTSGATIAVTVGMANFTLRSLRRIGKRKRKKRKRKRR